MHLYLVHNAERKKFKCAFNSIVIKNGSLVKSYNGGLHGFIDKYYARCNEYISVACSMGDGIDGIVDDLIQNGMEMDKDFKFFDASRLAFNIQLGLNYLPLQKDVNIGVDWLKCKYDFGDIYVWYVDDKLEV